MKYFLMLVLIFSMVPVVNADCNKLTGKIGAGYKFEEMDYIDITFDGEEGYINFYSDPISARMELTVECDRINFGIAHHSQYGTGWPVNNEGEYYKTEFFIDVKFDIWEF